MLRVRSSHGDRGFVAPYLLDTTTRFVAAAARLPDTRTALITCEPADRLPPARRGGTGATTVSDGMVIVRHPELARAMEIARAFAGRLQLYAE